MDLGLKGKRALVTGGTRGIGLAIVKLLAQEGASVATCARSKEAVAVAQAQFNADGDTVTASVCDVSDKATYASWIESSAASLGGVDIFVANVSGGVMPGEEGWHASFNVDLMGTVRGCERVIPVMAQGSGGAIVIISSISGLEAMGGAGAYGSMKAALLSYSSQLAEDVGPHNIRVNAVSPGPIHVDDGFWGDVKRAQPEMYEAVCARQHGGRMGTTEEVANSVVFLASDAASWVTGTNMIVDGGYTKRVQF